VWLRSKLYCHLLGLLVSSWSVYYAVTGTSGQGDG